MLSAGHKLPINQIWNWYIEIVLSHWPKTEYDNGDYTVNTRSDLCSKYCIVLLITMYMCDHFEMNLENRTMFWPINANREDRQLVSPGTTHKRTRAFPRKTCVACNSHINSENMVGKKYTLQKQHAINMVIMHCRSYQVWNGLFGLLIIIPNWSTGYHPYLVY